MTPPSLGRSLLGVALATAAALLVPAIAMQFTSEVAWGPIDFLAAGAILFLAGAAIVVARRRMRQALPRRAAVTAIVVGAALVWAELAVGVFR